MLDLFSLSREELHRHLDELGDFHRYVADQVFDWVYRKHANSFADMTNISLSNRNRLAAVFSLELPSVADLQTSIDGTVKLLIELQDGRKVETVHIPELHRATLCVSTQVGCKLGCRFCRTGKMGFVRHLGTSEIVAQVVLARRMFGDKENVTNVVFMGMGEPLDNDDHLLAALAILGDDRGLAQSPRRTTVSTAGLVPKLDRLLERPTIGIAVSLNATRDDLRGWLMPVNRTYPLAVLLEALRSFPLPKRRRFTIEYILFAGLNDEPKHARELVTLLHGIPAKVNLIPYNENGIEGLSAPTEDRVQAFFEALAERGLQVNVRKRRGADIAAACGQLATVGTKTAGR
ncbi:MAG: 23S rRNA (adenine(2503)-C(2))-methyltransferase [Deltaproteobacteria bacterium RIFOXYA12_FULL_61_11]|nr:MAG: 23S rRNA (adenine(2503)-C(2))-methyltransferase [Deltaproteobacteria bacterium RIFOXYA12_FULL_61_11]